jgi:YHS domain-containing protein
MAIVAKWRFYDNANDTMGVNNGTASNITYAPGIVNKSAYLNGINAKIDCGNNASLNFGIGVNFTISGWIKRATQNAHKGWVINKGGSANGRYWFGIIDESARYGVMYGGNVYYGGANDFWGYVSSNYKDYSWHFIVMVIDKTGSALKSYYDGKLITNDTSLYNGNNTLATNLIIGLNDTFYFEGFISDLEICNTAKKNADIKNRYAHNKGFF